VPPDEYTADERGLRDDAESPRPTCVTCPYWHLITPSTGFAQCRRFPAHQDAGLSHDAQCPSNHWCGEHPDFPAWIKGRRQGT